MGELMEIKIRRRQYLDGVIAFVCVVFMFVICKWLGIHEISDIWGLFLGLLVCLPFLLIDKLLGDCWNLMVEFSENAVTFQKTSCEDAIIKRKHGTPKCIPYQNIKEVQKIMVIKSRASEQGRYELRVKTARGNYRLFTPDEAYDNHANFEDTGLYQLYESFKGHGIKCC